MPEKSNGFSLIEISIVLFIVGLLAAFAYPCYTQHVIAARRLEAATILSRLSVYLEHYHMEHGTYKGATLAALHFSEIVAQGSYGLRIQSVTDNDYVLVVKPLAAQGDPGCGMLILDAAGERKITGKGNIKDCW